VAPDFRGKGIARALIGEVARIAKGDNAVKFYWLTHSENQVARELYDKIARFEGFIRYDYPIGSSVK